MHFLLDTSNKHVLADVIVGDQPTELLLGLLLVVKDAAFAPTFTINLKIFSRFFVLNPRKDQQLLVCIGLRFVLRDHKLC